MSEIDTTSMLDLILFPIEAGRGSPGDDGREERRAGGFQILAPWLISPSPEVGLRLGGFPGRPACAGRAR